MATSTQRKLEFKVRKSTRLSSKTTEVISEDNSVKRERRRTRKKESVCISPRKRSGSDSESDCPVKTQSTCSPNKKKKDALVPVLSRETPSKTCLIERFSGSSPLSPRKDNIDKMTRFQSPTKDKSNIKQSKKSKKKEQKMLLNSPIKENICIQQVSPFKNRVVLGSPNNQILSSSPTKRQLLLGSPLKNDAAFRGSSERILHKSPTKQHLVFSSPSKQNGSPSKLNYINESPTKRQIFGSPSKIRTSLRSPTKESRVVLSSRLNENSPTKCSPLKDLHRRIASPSKKPTRATNAVYYQVKQSLHTAKPERLVGRDKEVGEINQFLNNCLNKQSAGSLYISGAPGTGKTAALLHIIDDVKEEYECKVCYLNCMMVKDSCTVFKKLYEEIKGKALSSKRDPTRSMEKCLTSSKSSIILVLDEIDQLDSKSQEVLYTIFEWPTLPNSKLILIGIANALDLTDRILPRLQAQPKCRPQLLNFAPYSREQITAVIQDRLKQLEVEGVCVVEPSAIQFCARKVSAVAGDMRKALDVCRRAVELVEAEIRSHQKIKKGIGSPVKGGNSKEIKKIGVMQISKVISEVYGTGVKTSTQKEETVPLQQKLVTCSLLLMLKTGKAKEVAMGKLHETYGKLCRKRQMAAVDQSEFFSLCELLEARGVMGLKKGKETRLTKVSLKLDEKEIEHALQDKVLITTILQEGI